MMGRIKKENSDSSERNCKIVLQDTDDSESNEEEISFRSSSSSSEKKNIVCKLPVSSQSDIDNSSDSEKKSSTTNDSSSSSESNSSSEDSESNSESNSEESYEIKGSTNDDDSMIFKYKFSDKKDRKLRVDSESTIEESIINRNNNLEDLLNNLGRCEESVEDYFNHTSLHLEISEIINLENLASYNYTFLWSYFMSEKVALDGFSSLYNKLKDYHRQVFDDFIRYIIQIGGKLSLKDLPSPKINLQREGLGDALESVRLSLKIEKKLLDKFLELKKSGIKNYDINLLNYLNTYIESSTKILRTLTILCTKIKRGGNGQGILMIDKELIEEKY